MLKRGLLNWTRSFSKNEALTKLRENKLTVLLFVFLLCGVVFGTVSARFTCGDALDNLDFLFASNFKKRALQTPIDTFVCAMTSSFIFIFGLSLLALSVWGLLAIPMVPFFKGLGVGLTAGYLYAVYGLRGVAFHVLVLLPGVFISSVAVVLHARESLSISARLASKVFPKSDIDKLWPSLKLYLVKTGGAFIVVAASAAADVIFALLFARWFVFA